MSELSCSGYVMVDSSDGWQPAHCPECGAFLKAFEDVDEEIVCRKCGATLMCFPETDEETGEPLEYGKICPISKSNRSDTDGVSKY